MKTLAKLIHSNSSTIKSIINNGTMFRGERYLSYLPFNLTDTPLIYNWSSNESHHLILEIIKQNNIRSKKLFLFIILIKNLYVNLKVLHTLSLPPCTGKRKKELNINHDLIKICITKYTLQWIYF